MTRIRHREKLSGTSSVALWRGSCKTNDRHDRKIRGQKNTCRPAICRVGQRRSEIHFSVPFIFLSVFFSVVSSINRGASTGSQTSCASMLKKTSRYAKKKTVSSSNDSNEE